MDISPSLDGCAQLVGRHRSVWIRLGDLESRLLIGLEDERIDRPVFICGLARSGSTMLHQILASHPDAATHRRQDFPFTLIPYFWRQALRLNLFRREEQRERAHGDRIMVGRQSPEALEEMVWMSFFDHLHDPTQHHVLDEKISAPRFETFYRNHIRKILRTEKKTCYIAKANYHVTRLLYLSRLFPDARFVIPVRQPHTHIASLMRQHKRFCEAGRADPRVPKHMALMGHFEFGLNFVPIHTGDAAAYAQIQEAFTKGEEVRGWALYWNAVYTFLRRQVERQPELAKSVHFVAFEDLCTQPEETIGKLLAHVQLENEEIPGKWAPFLRLPDYYKSPLTASDLALIGDLTDETAGHYYPKKR